LYLFHVCRLQIFESLIVLFSHYQCVLIAHSPKFFLFARKRIFVPNRLSSTIGGNWEMDKLYMTSQVSNKNYFFRKYKTVDTCDVRIQLYWECTNFTLPSIAIYLVFTVSSWWKHGCKVPFFVYECLYRSLRNLRILRILRDLNFWFGLKGTVSVISSDPLYKNRNVWFTAVPSTALSD